MAKMKAKLEIVRGETAKLSKWAPVTWKHPEIRPENRPNPSQPHRMTAAQRSRHLHGEQRPPLVWPFATMALMAMGALMVAAALS